MRKIPLIYKMKLKIYVCFNACVSHAFENKYLLACREQSAFCFGSGSVKENEPYIKNSSTSSYFTTVDYMTLHPEKYLFN